jgi:di/tricarboxylate transporter
LDFRQDQRLTAVAMRRGERSYRTDVGNLPLALGDTLLVVGRPESIQSLRSHTSFLLLEAEPGEPVVDRRHGFAALLITLLAIGASIAGAPTYLAVFSGALLIVVARILSMEAAYQAIEWPVIFQIAGMVAVSQAMVQTGLSKLVGEGVLALAAPLGPLGLAGGAFLLAALLAQFMGGQVTALVVGPVTISAAISLGVNPQAVAVATAIGCSAAFLTPMAHPVNILMMTPGGYRFGDFFKIGWLLVVLCFGVLLLGMKLFWGL